MEMKPSSNEVESTDVSKENDSNQKENFDSALEELSKDKNRLKGRLAMEASASDIEGFKGSALELLNNLISEAQLNIKKLDEDFASGNFQNRGNSEDPRVTDIYESQVLDQKKEIAFLQNKVEQWAQNDKFGPSEVASVTFSQRINYSEGDPLHTLRRALDGAENLKKWEQDGFQYRSDAYDALDGALDYISSSNNPDLTRNALDYIRAAMISFSDKLSSEVLDRLESIAPSSR